MEKISKFCNTDGIGCPVVLASASPRRCELLRTVIPEFEIIPSDYDESSIKIKSPRKLVEFLSQAKAQNVKEKIGGGKIIIAADTVVFKGKIYGKPKDFLEAVNMLSKFNGKRHKVFTGVTVIFENGSVKTFSVCSKVKFKQLLRSEIEYYVDAFSPYDKAGAYAIQDSELVEKYYGSYSNIVGLPVEKLAKVLEEN